MRNLKKEQHGLSMIEMMFSMLVLFMVGVFVMDMFVSGSRQLVRASKNEKLSALLRAKVSETRLIDYADLATATKSGSFAAPNDDFDYKLDYENFQAFPQSEARIVIVSVSHPELGEMKNRIVRSAVAAPDPGEAAFNKFGCASCHSLSGAGYAAAPLLVPLDAIGDSGLQRPYQADPSISFSDYIVDSMRNPAAFDPYPDGDATWTYSDQVMTTIYEVEGLDPDIDHDTGVSTQEMNDLADWIQGFDT